MESLTTKAVGETANFDLSLFDEVDPSEFRTEIEEAARYAAVDGCRIFVYQSRRWDGGEIVSELFSSPFTPRLFCEDGNARLLVTAFPGGAFEYARQEGAA